MDWFDLEKEAHETIRDLLYEEWGEPEKVEYYVWDSHRKQWEII